MWNHLDDNYFQRFEATEIGWHTRTLWSRATPERPIVRARLSSIGEGLQVLVYAPDEPGLFARITTFFERMQFVLESLFGSDASSCLGLSQRTWKRRSSRS